MGLFGKIIKTGIHIATTPIDLAKDVVTFGGLNTDQADPYTVQKARKLGRDLREVGQAAEDIKDSIERL